VPTYPNLIVDLDGTLLHTMAVSDAVTLPGRPRGSFIARETINALADISQACCVVLATGRSWAGTRQVVESLEQSGATVGPLVLENGALVRGPGTLFAAHSKEQVAEMRRSLDRLTPLDWPDFEWQWDFEGCLVARAATPQLAATLAEMMSARIMGFDPPLRCDRDGRKVYLMDANVDKWSAVKMLLGPAADLAMGIGDGANDLCWLSRVAYPCTVRGAFEEVIDVVRTANGLVSNQEGHIGILDVLTRMKGRLLPGERGTGEGKSEGT
jgi:hydroxymethylpyrimidine pyrophosphatase-like HAD family hydrolase